jgi:hypothetical protein
MEQSGDN